MRKEFKPTSFKATFNTNQINYREASQEARDAWFTYKQKSLTTSSADFLADFLAGFNAAKALFEKTK